MSGLLGSLNVGRNSSTKLRGSRRSLHAPLSSQPVGTIVRTTSARSFSTSSSAR